jgi:hypothetical protein
LQCRKGCERLGGDLHAGKLKIDGSDQALGSRAGLLLVASTLRTRNMPQEYGGEYEDGQQNCGAKRQKVGADRMARFAHPNSLMAGE